MKRNEVELRKEVSLVEDLLGSGRTDEARERLQTIARKSSRGTPRRAVAELAEKAGLPALAADAWRREAEEAPSDTLPLKRLALLLEEDGEWQEAVALLEKAVGLGDPDPKTLRVLVDMLRREGLFDRARKAVMLSGELGMPKEVLAPLERSLRAPGEQEEIPWEEEEDSAPSKAPEPPGDDDVFRFLHAFSGREGIHARQWWDPVKGAGGYSPVREPLSFKVARNHLLGATTVGSYVVRLDDTVNFFAFDIDMTKRAIENVKGDPEKARGLREAVVRVYARLRDLLDRLEIPALGEESGYKGRHLWILLEKPVDAALARQFGMLALASMGRLDPGVDIEFFPKQSRTGKGIGNLIKLPLGVHRRTGRWSRLLGADGRPAGDPHGLLRAAGRLSPEHLCSAVMNLKRSSSALQAPKASEHLDDDRGEEETNDDPPLPLPEPGPAWTAADFDLDPQIFHVLSRCPVLASLKDQALETRRLSYKEQLALRHTLGHLPRGVLAVNWIFERCGDVPAQNFLKSPLSGNPVSCAKLRRRVKKTAARVCRRCKFKKETDTYPHPLRHMEDAPAMQGPDEKDRREDRTVEDMGRQLGSLMAMDRDLDREAADLRVAMLESMKASGADRIAYGEGEFVLHEEKGEVPSLEWVPAREGGGTNEAEPEAALPAVGEKTEAEGASSKAGTNATSRAG